ncbi:MAG: hypothetical protein Q4C72_04570 [Eubacteriales bacterium]|nr:hypothetical protein [Eubacteriales bacterium]
MVKGVSRRVVVVQPDERGLFEQAIFLVRDYTVPRSEAVREACRIANGYLSARAARFRRRFAGWQVACAFALGLLAASAVWTAVLLICK